MRPAPEKDAFHQLRRSTPRYNKRPWDDISAVLSGKQTPLQDMLERMHAEDASLEERNEMAKAAAPYIHRRRGHVVEGDETEGQTIVIQVMDYGGGDAEALPAPDVVEGEAPTVRVEGPD